MESSAEARCPTRRPYAVGRGVGDLRGVRGNGASFRGVMSSVRVPQVSAGLDRAAGWAWRLLVCVAAIFALLALLWYLRVIVLPALVALTISPALTPLTARFRR